MNFEYKLRQSLRREPAPPDFAARVLARAAAKGRIVPFWRRPAALALAAALLLAGLIPPTVSEYQRREEERAADASTQVLTALSITKAQLQRVGERVQRRTRHTI